MAKAVLTKTADDQSLEEIFKGFRERTPQNLHKQFMTRTHDNRANQFLESTRNKTQVLQRSTFDVDHTFTPNRYILHKRKGSKSKSQKKIPQQR